MKNKRGILFLLLFFIMGYMILTLIFSIPSGHIFDHTVFIGNFTKIKVENGKINVTNNNEKIKKQPVKIFFKNKLIDGYIVSENGLSKGLENSYNISNIENTKLSFDSSFVVFTPDISIDIQSGDYYETDDLNVFNEYKKINNLNINEYAELSYQEISKIDLNEDGINEYVYSLSLYTNDETVELNDEFEENDNKEYYTFVFMKNEEKIYNICNLSDEYNEDSNINLRFFKLIDFNKDGNYEFVVEKSMSEYGPYYYELYNFDGSKFTKIGGE